MNIYKSLRVPGGGFTNGQTNLEVYGTSWERDLLKAWQLQREALAGYMVQVGNDPNNQQALTSGPLRINGLTDPTYWAHISHRDGGHSVGLGIDMGISPFIGVANQEYVVNAQTQQPISGNPPAAVNGASIGPFTGGWSLDNAIRFSAMLPSVPFGNIPNNQRGALRNFLALYAVTRDDGDSSNGIGWDNISVANSGAKESIFGSGQAGAQAMISNVWIGSGTTYQSQQTINGQNVPVTVTENGFENIRTVLEGLDINTGPQSGHHNHFHVDVRRPDRVALPPNLLADGAVVGQTQTVADENLLVAAQALLEQVQPTLNFEQGDVTMFVMDMPPDVPPQYAPVVIAQASQAKNPAKTEHTIGVCALVENPIEVFDELSGLKGQYSAVNAIGPEAVVRNYLMGFDQKRFDSETTTVTVLRHRVKIT